MAIESYCLREKVSGMVLELPGVYQKLCYDTPAFYIGKKFFVRLKQDGTTIVVYIMKEMSGLLKMQILFLLQRITKITHLC